MSKFDHLASTWDEKPSRIEMSKTFANLISKSVNIPKNCIIIDYGCGTGTCALSLSKFASQVIGVDSSNKMLNIFKEKSKDFDTSFDFICEDLQKSDIVLPKCDLIISTMTFHHLKNPNSVVDKFYKTLKPEGYVAIADLDVEDGTFHDDGNEGVEYFGFDRAYIFDILKNAGFTDIEAQTAKIINKNNKSYSIFLITAKRVLPSLSAQHQ